MTGDELRARHAAYYRPRNAFFYTYGSFDLVKTLQEAGGVIDEFEVAQRTVGDAAVTQAPWDSPRKCVHAIPSEEMGADGETKCKAVLAWLCPDVRDDQLMTDLCIVNDLVSSTCNAPAYKALVKAGIAERLMMCEFNQDSFMSRFTIGVDGINEENAGRFEEIVMEVLRKVSKNRLYRFYSTIGSIFT